MEFDKSRVYTALNADELKPGDKVIVADTLVVLRGLVCNYKNIETLRLVLDEDEKDRFCIDNFSYAFAYLVERKENCTNCGEGKWDAQHQKILCDPVHCGNGNVVFRNHEIEVCEYWKPISKQKAEKCEDCKKAYTDYPCVANVYHDATGRACENFEAEKHFRPFKDIDELIKVWREKNRLIHTDYSLTMPYIWVRRKTNLKDYGHLVTDFNCVGVTVQGQGYAMSGLFANFEFLDGSVCGVEE